MEKTRIYLCDIDGTLACHKENRSPYDESKVLFDKPLPTVEIITALFANGQKVIFFSGRTDSCANETMEWIKKYIPNTGPLSLYMRNTGDNRNDAVIKEELYNTYIKDKYEVIGVFDDRLRVCEMWYRLGLFVFNCNQGLKDF